MEGIDAYTNETIFAPLFINDALFIIIETFLYVCVSLETIEL